MMISRTRLWALAIGAAFLYAAAQTVQLVLHIKDVPVLELYLYELPVWLAVVAVGPIVFWLARRLPLFGPNAGRHFSRTSRWGNAASPFSSFPVQGTLR